MSTGWILLEHRRLNNKSSPAVPPLISHHKSDYHVPLLRTSLCWQLFLSLSNWLEVYFPVFVSWFWLLKHHVMLCRLVDYFFFFLQQSMITANKKVTSPASPAWVVRNWSGGGGCSWLHGVGWRQTMYDLVEAFTCNAGGYGFTLWHFLFWN
jgi:hypothetical protein